MAKIAVESERTSVPSASSGTSARPTGPLLAHGDGWSVTHLLCTSGPQNRPFEERHSRVSIAIVMAGSFQYHSAAGRELMTAGSLLLGNHGQSFECAHHHGTGDRCLSFGFSPDYFETLAADSVGHGVKPFFSALRLPPLRVLSPVVARACASLARAANGSKQEPWQEIGLQLAAHALQVSRGLSPNSSSAPPSAMARVTRTVRMIDRHPDAAFSLADLAREARLTPFHFLRTFQSLIGVTPHQYLLRARLRAAAIHLLAEPHRTLGSARMAGLPRILDIALDNGFGDVSNFNRAFRAEFGLNPRAYRLALV